MSQLFQQGLEYEADIFATNIAVTSLLSHSVTIGPEQDVLFLKEDDKNKIYLWHFAVYIFWRLFGNSVDDIGKHVNSTHPPILVRQYNIIVLTSEIVEGNADNESIKKEIREILAKSALEVENSLAEILISQRISILLNQCSSHPIKTTMQK